MDRRAALAALAAGVLARPAGCVAASAVAAGAAADERNGTAAAGDAAAWGHRQAVWAALTSAADLGELRRCGRRWALVTLA